MLGAKRLGDPAPEGGGGSSRAVITEKPRAQGTLGHHLAATNDTVGQVDLKA